MMITTVECRSDHAYIGYPVAFFWQGQRLVVDKILKEELSPAGYAFQVLTQDLGIFELTFDTITDEWSVEQP